MATDNIAMNTAIPQDDQQQTYEDAWAGVPADGEQPGPSDTPLQDAVAQVVVPADAAAADDLESKTMTQTPQDEFKDEWDKTEADKPDVDAESAAVVAAHQGADAKAADEYALAHSELEGEQK